MSTMQDDPVFIRFDTAVDGLRAGMKVLLNYQRADELEHIQAIITKYAPPVVEGKIENDTAAYIADVAQHCGVNPLDYFDIEVPENLIRLAQAIVRHEEGKCPDPTLPFWYPDEVYQEAAEKALNKPVT